MKRTLVLLVLMSLLLPLRSGTRGGEAEGRRLAPSALRMEDLEVRGLKEKPEVLYAPRAPRGSPSLPRPVRPVPCRHEPGRLPAGDRPPGAARRRQHDIQERPVTVTEESRKIHVSVLPKPPKTIEETGLSLSFLVELACKILYFGGVMSLSSLSEQLALPVSVSNDVMEFLKKERLAEVKKGGEIRAAYTFALTDLGTGAGPGVPAALRLRRRRPRHAGAVHGSGEETDGPEDGGQNRKRWTRAFEGVVLTPGLLERLGPAVNSGRSIFLYGPSGNGKTFLAERLAKVLKRERLHPLRGLRGHQVIRVFDPVNHVPRRSRRARRTRPAPSSTDKTEYDRRFVLCDRPVVVSGGELTLAMLDLSFDAITKFYEAPLQMKANGGVFLIDDLGRQLVRPFDLLNRWIVPLEKSRDYLSLQNGKKFEIPFDQIILFSTNIEPRQLADEAFLRRIGYKIKIDYLGEEEYVKICRQVCERIGLPFRPEVIRYLLDEEHGRRGVRLSACHPTTCCTGSWRSASTRGFPPGWTTSWWRARAGTTSRSCEPAMNDFWAHRGGRHPAQEPDHPEDDGPLPRRPHRRCSPWAPPCPRSSRTGNTPRR